MSFPNRYAILLDGEWLRYTLLRKNKEKYLRYEDILEEIKILRKNDNLRDINIYRIFYYTADPLIKTMENPIDGTKLKFATTAQYYFELINKLEKEPNFAVRRGQLVTKGWKTKYGVLKRLGSTRQASQIEGRDVMPDIQQKGVDMMIGIDMATLAIKKLVSTVIIVSGDSDLVPAMKLARTEGLRVYLATFGETLGPQSQLRIHTDLILS